MGMAIDKGRTSSIKEQIEDLYDVAPKDVDPETELTGLNSGEDEADDNEERRAHYVDVGHGSLRNLEVDGQKYAGVQSNRKALFEVGEAEEEDEDEDEEDEDEDQSEEEDEGVESNAADDDGLAEEERSVRNAKDYQTMQAKVKELLKKDERTLMREYSESVQADIKKGDAVRDDMQFFDHLIDLRIKLQRPLLKAISKRDSSQAVLQLGRLILSDLTALRSSFTPDSPCKRDYSTMSLKDIHTDIHSLDKTLFDHANKTIDKWSSKVQSSALSKNGQRFKALNQSAGAQLSESLQDRDRLIRRTLVNRMNAQEPLNDDIYDDTDFYQAQLKSHVARRLVEKGNTEAANSAALNILSLQKHRQHNKKKKEIDPHASKGRRIKYTIHEKMQNFMAPVPAGTWHGEQTDELFAGLFGQRVLGVEDDGRDEDVELDVDDGLRVFS